MRTRSDIDNVSRLVAEDDADDSVFRLLSSVDNNNKNNDKTREMK